MDIVKNLYKKNKLNDIKPLQPACSHAFSFAGGGVNRSLTGVQPVVEINQSSPSLDGEGWDGVINLVEEVLHLLAWRCQYKYGWEV